MLKINQIELENFGPFKGSQSIEFPDDPGVTIVYGENMRGKTSLLNAIRYALFGNILDRSDENISPTEYINWESQKEGNQSFKVVLHLEAQNSNYKLTRQFEPKSTVTEPQNDGDYTEEVYLMKDGSILGPDEGRQEIAQILPEQISRFFLFDGELLQQYEELLADESDMGRRIREAIERILGIPVLTNGRADLRELLDEAEKQESKAAQQSELTEELGSQLEATQEKRGYLQKELDESREDIADYQQEKAVKRDQLDEIDAVRGLVEEKDRLEEDNENIEEELERKQEELKDLMGSAWYSVLEDRIESRRSNLQDRRSTLQDQRTKASVAERLAARISDAIDENRCPICQQDIDSHQEDHLKEEIAGLNQVTDGGINSNEEFDEVVSNINYLNEIAIPNPRDRIESSITRIDELRTERASNQDRISEINENLDSSEEAEAAQLQRDIEELAGKISVQRDAANDLEKELEDTEQNIRNLKKQLDNASGDELKEERERRQLHEDVFELFREGVDRYRDELREDVERDASEIFLKLTTEPDYDRLEINENYGLTIIHEDGGEISVRSAGAEHVVALALMGALQNNAPLQGPIIMDTPFGRLDGGHVENIVQTLPSLTDQIVLLVYEDELEPEKAREILRGKLRKEYKMQRESARHTELMRRDKADE
jgi:DNA sulfur modification protein DndD